MGRNVFIVQKPFLLEGLARDKKVRRGEVIEVIQKAGNLSAIIIFPGMAKLKVNFADLVQKAKDGLLKAIMPHRIAYPNTAEVELDVSDVLK